MKIRLYILESLPYESNWDVVASKNNKILLMKRLKLSSTLFSDCFPMKINK